MAFDSILVGTVANDTTGDTLRAGGIKINANFAKAVEGPATTPVTDNTTVVFDSTSGRLVKQAGAAVAAEAGKFAPTGNITAGTGMYLPAANTVAFSTNGAHRMRIDSSGNVGIGTTNPLDALDLGSSTGSRALTWGGTGGTERFNSIWSQVSNASLVVGSNLASGSTVDTFITTWTGTGGAAAIRLNTLTRPGVIEFFTNGATAKTAGTAFTPTERMRIAADGKITAGAGTHWVGTVAQSASSAIIERGSNANGEFVKFADGTMICHFSANVTDQAIDTAYGSIFQGVRTFTFPVAFVGNPTPHNGSGSWGTSASWAGVTTAASTTAVAMRFYDVISRSTGTNIQLQFSAVGRWY